jgi:hypothetical protein
MPAKVIKTKKPVLVEMEAKEIVLTLTPRQAVALRGFIGTHNINTGGRTPGKQIAEVFWMLDGVMNYDSTRNKPYSNKTQNVEWNPSDEELERMIT